MSIYTTYATAEEAIQGSIDANCITRCQSSEENMEALTMECEDSAEGDELEFWGEDENGNEWRVHVSR